MTTPLLRAAGATPPAPVEFLLNGGDVLVLAPHPDDETLGCGGAIAALSDLGRQAQVVVVTDGSRSHPGSVSHPAAQLSALRAQEVALAVDILTGRRGPAPVLLGYGDNAAPDTDAAVDEAILRIEACLTASTRAVWASWGGDPHRDHVRTARIARRLAANHPGLALWFYPIWGRFEADFDTFDAGTLAVLDTGPWRNRKAAAMAAHASQMSGLIRDAPGGFRMSEAHQDHFLTTPEIFLQEAP